MFLSDISGIGDLKLTGQHADILAYCEISRDTGITNRKDWGGKDCPDEFQRNDRISTRGSKGASTRQYSPDNHNLCSRNFQRETRAIFWEGPLGRDLSTTTDEYIILRLLATTRRTLVIFPSINQSGSHLPEPYTVMLTVGIFKTV